MQNRNKPGIGVIGAGTMGAGIAQVASAAGHSVVLLDESKQAIDNAKSKMEKTLKSLSEKQKISEQTAKDILWRIKFTEDPSSLSECTVIIEAIIENLTVKQTLIRNIEKICQDKAVIATNTSSLSINSIASASKNPQNVIGIHFFNPVPLMPLVEIIPGLSTGGQVLADSIQLINSWGKTTVLSKDTPGFIVNRVARSFYGEAIRIFEEGIASFSTIDWAMKQFGGFKMGPFELMDFIGNDINYTVTETIWQQFFYDPRYRPSLTQKRLFEAKFFGRKSGKGYYDYAPNAVRLEPVQDIVLGEKIYLRILSMLINEAADALYLNIASKEDLDLAMTKGVNYPKGLLKWADEMGIDKILTVLENLQNEYAEDRYRPSVQFRKMIREGKKKFYE